MKVSVSIFLCLMSGCQTYSNIRKVNGPDGKRIVFSSVETDRYGDVDIEETIKLPSYGMGYGIGYPGLYHMTPGQRLVEQNGGLPMYGVSAPSSSVDAKQNKTIKAVHDEVKDHDGMLDDHDKRIGALESSKKPANNKK